MVTAGSPATTRRDHETWHARKVKKPLVGRPMPRPARGGAPSWLATSSAGTGGLEKNRWPPKTPKDQRILKGVQCHMHLRGNAVGLLDESDWRVDAASLVGGHCRGIGGWGATTERSYEAVSVPIASSAWPSPASDGLLLSEWWPPVGL